MTITERSVAPAALPKLLQIYKVMVRATSLDPYVYMTKRDDVTLENFPVVIVHAATFCSVWNDSQQYDWCKYKKGMLYRDVPELWEDTDKYRYTEKCFHIGISNPVPMALVSSFSNDGLYLTDGITRTMWLIKNGTLAFPVQCPHSDVAALEMLAGVDYGTSPAQRMQQDI